MVQTLIFDNGAGTIKAGYSNAQKPRLIPNCITKSKNERKRVYIGSQLEECIDRSSLFYLLPFQKGFLVNWDIEHQVWDHTFSRDCLNIDFSSTCIVLTEPYFNFTSVRDSIDEVIFEDYRFHSAFRTNAGFLSAHLYLSDNQQEQCCLIVDSGYSFTHIAPYFKGKCIKEGVVRISVGGKVLTNQLKEWISYRQLQVMEETYVMNQCKEDACFVSHNFNENMAIARQKQANNSIMCQYILPDYMSIQRGYIRTQENADNESDLQRLRLNQERFAVPEILFRPSDVGIEEMGIPEAIVYSIMEKCPQALRGRLFKNILLTGGNSLFVGYATRIESEVRSLAPDLFDIRIIARDRPISHAWQGGCRLAESNSIPIVTKNDYDENGAWRICRQIFDSQ